jgi:hypothetical protein
MAKSKRNEMDKIYDPHTTEKRLYEWWESQGYFKPETSIEKGLADPDQPSWCITMPPPNVTGALHLGHALTAATERPRDPLSSRRRSCRHRYPERGGTGTGQGGPQPP